MDNEIMDGLSMDIEAAEQDKLRSLFPQCFTDSKLDVTMLLAICGEFETVDENDRERYEFRWKGKQESLQLAGKRSAGTLRPCPEESVNWDDTENLYIEGDNLEVLKLLQTAYYRKVKMIYIDPPYNTGHDFVYEDDFADPLARYREITQQTTKSNPEAMGRFHTNWLNMMYPRLRLAANLLRDDGAIFISIDDNEVHNLRKVCDDVFGEENFVTNIVWQKTFSPKNDAKFFSSEHEHVLMYAKSLDSFTLKGLPRGEKQNARYKNPDNDPRGPWASSDLLRMEHRDNGVYSITSPSGVVFTPEPGTSWRHPQNEIQQLIDNNEVWFGDDGSSKPRRKRFLCDVKQDITPQTIWKHDEVGHTQSAAQAVKDLFSGQKIFDFPKPVSLIKRMLQISTEPDSIIFDFFSGSATTAHAVMQLNAEDGGNRRFIMVQLPEVTDEKSEAYKAGYKNICEIGKERIRRAGAKILDEQSGQLTLGEADNTPTDIGFRVFKLDTSNLKLWDDSPITGENALTELEARIRGMLDIIKTDRSNMDVVYEVMLKLGQELTKPIIPIDLGDGKIVYGVGTGEGAEVKFIVCLAAEITPEDAETMADYAPGRIVFADACFDNSEQKSNVRLTLKDKGIAIKAL